MDPIAEEGNVAAKGEITAVDEEKKPKADEKQGNCYW